jgi:UDP-N-acetylmuramoylalanine--D-glutamate ligase
MAKSGYAAAKLLHSFGAEIVVNDRSSLEDDPHANELKEHGIEVIGGGHPADLLGRKPFELIVKNPGIPYSNPVVQEALASGISVVTEVEIAGMISSAEFIAITGSNGKTTTTTLIGKMLEEDGKKAIVAGNIGTVLCEVAAQASEDEIIVSELSSFQLLGTKTFHPKIAVLLNLFDAHLDFHGTKEEYGAAKAKIFANQTAEDFSITNADDSEATRLSLTSEGIDIPFSTQKSVSNGVYVEGSTVFFKDEAIIHTGEIALPGQHNLENILAAVAAAKITGVGNEAIASVLKRFTGVRHRLQYVETVNERTFYNDSKATNILATKKAISAFEQPVILLAGGLDRGNHFDELIPCLKNVKAVVTFGETAKKINDTASKAGMKQIKHVDNVEQAVPVAYELSAPGDVILLSPACASWDQYRTFEERGDMFINVVHTLR